MPVQGAHWRWLLGVRRNSKVDGIGHPSRASQPNANWVAPREGEWGDVDLNITSGLTSERARQFREIRQSAFGVALLLLFSSSLAFSLLPARAGLRMSPENPPGVVPYVTWPGNQAYRPAITDLSSGSEWTNVTPAASPSPRRAHAMAYDTESNRIVLYGGILDSSSSDVQWSYDLETNTWTNLDPNSFPHGLWWPAMAYDVESDRIILFGGYGVTYEDETWAYDLDTNSWTNMDPTTKPSARSLHAIAYDVQSDRIVLFGGWYDERLGDTWAYDYNTNTWTDMSPATGPAARNLHAIAYDVQSDRIVLFGGNAMEVYTNETWAYDFDTNTWTNMNPVTRPNAPIAAMTYDSRADRIVLFGGVDSNETWSYDFDANMWTKTNPPNRPSARTEHAMAYDDQSGRVVLFGGTSRVGQTQTRMNNNDTWWYTIYNGPPVLNVPPSIVAEATGPSGATVDYTVTAEDDGDGSLIPACSPASGSVFPLGTTTVSCTARDSAGNEATATFTVEVRDSRPPVLTVPADIQVEATGPSGTPVTFEVTATDVVDPSPVVTCSPASGSTFDIGTTTVTCTATDSAGNTATASFEVTVTEPLGPPGFVLSPLAVAAVAVAIGVVAVTIVAFMRRRRKGRGPTGGEGGTL